MTEIYGEQHRAIQDTFGTKNLADRVNEIIVAEEIADDRKGFIESRDMFFLTTIDPGVIPPVLIRVAILAL
jgi:uncharacterized protein